MAHSDPSQNIRNKPEFLTRLRDGDEAAFDLLATTYGAPLIGHASRVVGSVESAREVVQDVFLRLWHSREHIDPDWDISAYLYGMTRRLALNVLKSEKAASQREYMWVTESMDTAQSFQAEAEEEDEKARIRTSIWNAMLELSPRCREVFMLVWDRHLPYSVIAQQLGIAEPTVRRHMSRAVQHLADVLGVGTGKYSSDPVD